MYKLFKIAKDNMKKQKGDMITFLVLTFLAAFLIFDCASAITGVGHVLDNTFADINGGHVILYCGDSDEETEAAEKVFKEQDEIISYEQTPLLSIHCKYRKKGDKEFMDYWFLAQSFDSEQTIMNVKRPVSECKKDDILLPFNLHTAFKEGDTIELQFDDDVYDFNVAGYIEDPYFCSTMNITTYSVIISQDMYETLEKDQANFAVSYMAHKGRVDEKKLEDGTIKTDDIEKKIGNAYKDEIVEIAKSNPEKNYTTYLLMNWQMMRGGSQFLPMVVIAIILIFAVLILVISIVIISFSVKNFIQKNMKNTGILEASGYTVSELRWALTLQIVTIGLVGSILGIGAAVMTFGGFGDIVASLLGLRWNQPVNWEAAVLTVLGVVFVLGLVARFISRGYKKISVLDALRGGINTHNFKKNLFSFESTPLPISATMALKDTFGGLGRNIIMVLISAILAVSMLTGFGFLENFGKNPDTIVDLMGFEMATAIVSDSDMHTDYEKVADDIEELDSVDHVFTLVGFEPVVKFGDKESTFYTYAADDIDKANNVVVTEGKVQKKDNEVMVTNAVAEDLGVNVGDVITISFADEKADYIIVGINQRVERMGRTIYMTIDGAKRIIPGNMQYQYYTTAKDGKTFDNIVKDLDKLEEDKDYSFTSTDEEKMMMSTLDSLSISMRLICVIISIITILVVVFVESLVIRAKISREWKGMGISKALGQTSGNLISQIMLSNMPAILVGTVLGAFIAPLAGKSAVKAAFSLFVIKSVPFDIPSYYMIITVVGIALVAIITSASAGLKVRSLKPVEMITEE
ncbi:ABC-type transport system, involved in lipoprotein release, permease component [Lachnospiraceae bacterium]|nr:ABC-type transport system, involved in lipoprotein release, permease component [Lachnospiraceae bacterium]